MERLRQTAHLLEHQIDWVLLQKCSDHEITQLYFDVLRGVDISERTTHQGPDWDIDLTNRRILSGLVSRELGLSYECMEIVDMLKCTIQHGLWTKTEDQIKCLIQQEDWDTLQALLDKFSSFDRFPDTDFGLTIYAVRQALEFGKDEFVQQHWCPIFIENILFEAIYTQNDGLLQKLLPFHLKYTNTVESYFYQPPQKLHSAHLIRVFLIDFKITKRLVWNAIALDAEWEPLLLPFETYEPLDGDRADLRAIAMDAIKNENLLLLQHLDIPFDETFIQGNVHEKILEFIRSK